MAINPNYSFTQAVKPQSQEPPSNSNTNIAAKNALSQNTWQAASPTVTRPASPLLSVKLNSSATNTTNVWVRATPRGWEHKMNGVLQKASKHDLEPAASKSSPPAPFFEKYYQENKPKEIAGKTLEDFVDLSKDQSYTVKGKVGRFNFEATSIKSSNSHKAESNNEDRFCAKDLTYGQLFGVFDGHGGDEVSKKLAAEFPRYLEKELSAQFKESDNPATAIPKALTQAFEKFNEAVKADETLDYSGSCANVAFIHGDEVYIANVGDSRAVLYKESGQQSLSADHTIEDEKAAIEARGGVVREGKGESRVALFGEDNQPTNIGGLAIPRAIGDKHARGVRATPDISRVPLQGGHLVLGSDGVWKQRYNHTQSASDIVQQATLGGSNDDNSAIRIDLN